MAPVQRVMRRTETVALETMRWREETRRWIPAGCLPATREQLTAQLMLHSAPSWLLWRLNACLPNDRKFSSVDEIVRLMRHGRSRAEAPPELYAG